MWIVTYEINEYNQEGAYFLAAYLEKPTFHQLRKLIPDASDTTIGKLTRGGGREGTEYLWYSLDEVEDGQEL